MAESGEYTSEPFTDADIQQLLDEEASTEKTPGWKSVSKSDLTEVSRKSTKGDKLHLIKAFLYLPSIPSNAVLELCTDVKLRSQWDTHFHQIEVVEQFIDYTCLYWRIKMPTGFTDRDLLQYMWVKKDDRTNTTFILFKPATHPDFPEKKDFIRAQTVLSGLIIRPDSANPDSTRVTVLVKNDAKGKIPKAAVNHASEKGMDKWRTDLVKFYTEVYAKN